MSKLTINQKFHSTLFGDLTVLTYEDGNLWFIAKEVCEKLGYSNTSKAISDHCKGANETLLPSKGGMQTMKIIPERDVYRLVMRSKLPDAEKFEDFVVSEVLPSIRKAGRYEGGTMSRSYTIPETFSDALQLAANQARLLEMQAPKVDYFDALVESQLLTNFRDTAKELHINQNYFIDFLLANGFIYRDTKSKLKPYAQYTPKYFEIKDKARGKWAGTQTLITPHGKQAFKMLLEGRIAA